MASSFQCAQAGCDRHPSRGDTIIRTSPKGEDFQGLCSEHMEGAMELVAGYTPDLRATPGNIDINYPTREELDDIHEAIQKGEVD